jgi:hypothetical protein
METNQDDPRDGGEAPAGEPAPGPAGDTRAAALAIAHATAMRARVGLLLWGGVTTGGMLLAMALGRADVAPFLALAAIFALASSWDARDRVRTGDPLADLPLDSGELGRAFRLLVLALPALLSGAAFGGLASFAAGLEPSAARTLAAQWSVAAAIVCFALALPRVSGAAARLFVPRSTGPHTARLTASLAVAVLLLPVPVRLLFDEFGRLITESGRPLIEVGGLLSQLVGELAIALAAVGLWVARGARETAERLGLGPMGLREWGIAALGLAAVAGLNTGLEALERAWLPDLWQADQAMSRQLVGTLTLSASLVLGISAGVGEEVLVRGALQPRTGILWASVLFGAAHIQYTWFGMLAIALLGIALGLVRRFANTTTAIVVHGAYDVVAALGTRS